MTILLSAHPSPDMWIEEIRLLNADEDIIQTWSSLDVSLHEVLKDQYDSSFK